MSMSMSMRIGMSISISMSMSMFYMSCPYVPYLTLPYLGYCNCYRMLGYGTGTGTGTVREGKVYGIPFLIPTYLTSDTYRIPYRYVGRCC